MTSKTPSSTYPPPALSKGIRLVQEAVRRLVANARSYYYEVIYAGHICPDCASSLSVVGPSQCRCESGHHFDPTIAFEKSPCCFTGVRKRFHHYECRRCKRTVQSRFLFDERVFDAQYFAKRMREARKRKKHRTFQLRTTTLTARSQSFALDLIPTIQMIEGLEEALDKFVGSDDVSPALEDMNDTELFDIGMYRMRILAYVEGAAVLFSAIPSVSNDLRTDRARRFVTLVYMEHEGEIALTETDDDLLVEPNEAHAEG